MHRNRAGGDGNLHLDQRSIVATRATFRAIDPLHTPVKSTRRDQSLGPFHRDNLVVSLSLPPSPHPRPCQEERDAIGKSALRRSIAGLDAQLESWPTTAEAEDEADPKLS